MAYVSDYYGGSLTSLARFSEAFLSLTEEFARNLPTFSTEAGYAAALNLVGAAYQAMTAAGDEGALRDGVNYTNELVLSYGADRGEQDAGAFLALFGAEA